MPCVIVYEKKVVRNDIPRIPPDIKPKIIRAIEERLVANPLGAGEPLYGQFAGLRRFRFSEWRIVYEVDAGKLIIYSIKNRKNVYRG